MTDHDNPSTDEREAIEQEFYRRHAHGFRVVKTIVDMVLAERRNTDRRVEEARAKALQDLAVWHEGQVEILRGELARSSGEVTHAYRAIAHHQMAVEEARAFIALAKEGNAP